MEVFLQNIQSKLRVKKFSPRMWRCFSCAYVARYVTKIFSTYVEVFLLFRKLSGVSIIFSTYVEVFLINAPVRQSLKHFLHVCGGVSIRNRSSSRGTTFSPRMWRCFCNGGRRASKTKFSPRMWRCFQRNLRTRYGRGIFSTYVEVFPIRAMAWKPYQNFLHVCGGVSEVKTQADKGVSFSPRMWRCFLQAFAIFDIASIFSTYVEVFLEQELKRKLLGNFLHVCGGVSAKQRLPFRKSGFSPRMWRCFPIFLAI